MVHVRQGGEDRESQQPKQECTLWRWRAPRQVYVPEAMLMVTNCSRTEPVLPPPCSSMPRPHLGGCKRREVLDKIVCARI